VELAIDADLCGPVSVGTVGVIRLLAETLELSIPEAKRHVDRCVFDAEVVQIPAPSAAAARAFVERAAALRTGARVRARALPRD
jgi:hypothetical protein